MEVRVLGPVEITSPDGPVHLARRQQRLILGILAIEVNRVVSRDRLVDLLWGDRPPRLARAVVQSRVSELRAVLAVHLQAQRGGLLTRGGGYLLNLRPELVDAYRLRRLVEQARTAGTDRDVRTLLRKALGLWRGPVLGGWLPADSHAAVCHGLDSIRLTAAEDLFDVELRLGNQQSTVDEIAEMAAANPTRERLTAQAMVALHRTGRTAEALQAYERCRRWLADQLGADPGSDLQNLHVAILRADPAVAARATDESTKPATTNADTERRQDPAGPTAQSFKIAVPGILPADVPDFTGRKAEVALLGDILTRPDQGVAVAAVSGPAGVGKTSLAVHVAHHLRAAFPDGQLFANLHGIEADAPIAPDEILGRFLRALGVDGLALPASLDERVDLYRDLLAQRRVLIMLDNAGSAEQVVPLLPGGRGCAVVVTSRTRLGHAIGAATIGLDVLDSVQATDLLTRIVGAARINAEPEAAADLTRLSGYLPLAIRVAAAKLAAKPHWSVRRLVAQLDDEHKRLHHLTYGHLDVRSSIALSYHGLPVECQRLLRRLGDIAMPEINVWASAALLDSTTADAEEALEQLYDAQLVEVVGRDPTGHARYRLHDLVRLLARERAESEETVEELGAAHERCFGAWLSFVEAVHRSVFGGNYQNIRNLAPRWPLDEQVIGRALEADPLGWFETERSTIVAMIGRAQREGCSDLCWGLACTVSPLIQTRRYFDEWQAILDMAFSATVASGDDLGSAAVHYRLALLAADRNDFDQAHAQLDAAGQLFVQVGDRHGQATVRAFKAMVERFAGRRDEAVRLYEQAIPDLREHGDAGGEALALRCLGQLHLDRGDYVNADKHLAQALAVSRRGRSRVGNAQIHFWQGMLRLKQGRHRDAEVLFTEVLEATRALGDRVGESQALRGLGLCYRQQGNTGRARATLSEALSLVRQPRPTLQASLIERDIADL